MSLSNEALFAALSEEVYQRSLEDTPLRLQDLTLTYGFAFAPNEVVAAGLVSNSGD
jgi:hypothetical protein